MKKILLITALLILLGCDETPLIPPGYECEFLGSHCRIGYAYKLKCERNKQADFILTCALNANPLSDEEGEDLVEQCEKTSKNLFCEKVFKK